MAWVSVSRGHNDRGGLGFGAKFPSLAGSPGSQPGGIIMKQNHCESGYLLHNS